MRKLPKQKVAFKNLTQGWAVKWRSEKRKVWNELKEGGVTGLVDYFFERLLSLSIPQVTEEGEAKEGIMYMPIMALGSFMILTGSTRQVLLTAAYDNTISKVNVMVFLIPLSIAWLLCARWLIKVEQKVVIDWLFMCLSIVLSVVWLSTAAGTIVDVIQVASS